MKSQLLLFIFCFCPFLSYAQAEGPNAKKTFYPEDRRWMLNVITLGTNIDLSGSSSNPDSELLGSRPAAAFMVKYGVTHLFSKKVGWYANIQIDNFWDRRSEYYNDLASDELLSALFESIGESLGELFLFMHPSFNAGLVYRIEHGRWRLHPEIGVGYGSFLQNREKSKSKTDDKGVEHRLTYKQRASSLYMNVGLSANYFISQRCFFVLNAGFKQPLRKSRAELIHTKNEVEANRLAYETNRLGRSLNLSLGFGVTIGRNHE